MAASTLTSCVDWYALKMSGCSAASQGRTFLSPRSCGVCRRTSTPLGSMFSFASFGQGPVGLSATQLAVEMGARVIASTSHPSDASLPSSSAPPKDLWSRGPSRIPHLIHFETEPLQNEQSWDFDLNEYATLLINTYAFENMTTDENFSKASSIGNDRSLVALRQEVETARHKTDFIGNVSIATFASILSLSILLLGFGQTGIVVSIAAGATWVIVFAALKSTFPGKGK